jgi:hypothetical protein
LIERMKVKSRSRAVWNWNFSKRGAYSARVASQRACGARLGLAPPPRAGTAPPANRLVMLRTRFTRLPRSFARSLL